jgi:Mor family transcriptional regulator
MPFLRQAVEDFPDLVLAPYNLFMNENGFEAIYKFSNNLCGLNLYIPGIDSIFKKCIEQEMLKQYTGNNNRILIEQSGYSAWRFRNLRKINNIK